MGKWQFHILVDQKQNKGYVTEQHSSYGYNLNIEVNGQYDKMTCDVVRSFNRHFCPEVFIKETIDYSTNLTVHVAENERWYGISQERLQFILAIL